MLFRSPLPPSPLLCLSVSSSLPLSLGHLCSCDTCVHGTARVTLVSPQLCFLAAMETGLSEAPVLGTPGAPGLSPTGDSRGGFGRGRSPPASCSPCGPGGRAPREPGSVGDGTAPLSGTWWVAVALPLPALWFLSGESVECGLLRHPCGGLRFGLTLRYCAVRTRRG